MRKLLLLASLFISLSAFGQISRPSATFTVADTSADSGTNICLPVTVRDFSNGVAFSFAINWSNENPNLRSNLTYVGVRSFNAQLNARNSFTAANFNEDFVSSNILSVQWQSYEDGEDCEDSDVTITEDGVTLFEICFFVDGDIADQTFIRFQDLPDPDPFDEIDQAVPITFVKEADCDGSTPFDPAVENGSITIGIEPVKLALDYDFADLQPGDQFCVDINVVSGFNGLSGLQFPVVFNSNILQVVADENGSAGNSTYPSDLLPGHGPSSYRVSNNGTQLRFQWSDLGGGRYDVPDGAKLATICFEIVGECGRSTELFLESQDEESRAPTEAVGGPSGQTPIPVATAGTTFRINNCNTDAFDIITSNCPEEPLAFGTQFCINIDAGDDLQNMRRIDYLILFDEDIIEFERTGMSDEDVDNRNFDITQRDRGILAFEYPGGRGGSARLSIDEGGLVYQLCFRVVGLSGTTSVQFAQRRQILGGNPTREFPGINPTSCAITVQDSDGIRLDFDEPTSFARGEETCVDLFADGFTEVTAMRLPVFYFSGLLEFTRIEPNPIAPGIQVGSGASDGFFFMEYNGPAFTLPADEPLASVCFRGQPDAEAGACDSIGFINFGGSVTKNVDGGSRAIPVESSNIDAGDYCILFPDGFGLDIGSAEAFINQQVCIPVSVNSFDDITTLNVNFEYPPDLFQLDTIIFTDDWPGTIADFDLSNAGTGLINWASDGPFDPIPDSTTIFELCFQTQITEDCGEIVATDGASPPTTTQTSPMGSIIYSPGEICVEDRVIVDDISVTPASCSDNQDGAVRVTFGNRGNTETIFIQASSPRRTSDSSAVARLNAGMQTLVFFNATGSIRFDTTIMVPVDSTNIPVADAGEDQTLSCGEEASAILDGRNNDGVTFQVYFLPQTGGRRPVGEMRNLVNGSEFSQRVIEAGRYAVEVRSETGCVAVDTVIVEGLGLPSVSFSNTVPDITCDQSEVTVSAQGADFGPGFETRWERVTFADDDFVVLDTVSTDISFTTDQAGQYRYVVEDLAQGCSNDTVVRVSNNGTPPRISLSPSAQLSCAENSVLLSGGSPQDDIDYRWVDVATGQQVSDSINYLATMPGAFALSATEDGTGCASRDTIIVEDNLGAPAVTAAEETLSFSCTDTLLLRVDYANTNNSTRYRWRRAADSEGFILGVDASLPEARVTGPGTFTVIADNGGCADSTIIVVTEPVAPNVEAGAEVMLECNQSVTLNGGSEDQVSFAWMREDQAVSQGQAAAVTVELPGTYFLTVTDLETGCIATDSVLVVAAGGFPEYTVENTNDGLGCEGSSVTLNVAPTNVGADYTYAWTDTLGTPLAGDTTALEVFEEGTYLVSITNNETGCVSQEPIVVTAEAQETPFIFFSDTSPEIECESQAAEIIPGGSSTGPEFEYTYANVSGGQPIEEAQRGGNNLTVNSPGVYSLTIRNTNTNCSTTENITVGSGPGVPQVTFNDPVPLDCNNRSSTISIAIAGGTDGLTIDWSAPPTADPIPDGTTEFTVDRKGTFAVLVFDENLCRFEGQVRVLDLTDSIADIEILPADTFDCGASSLTLDASPTTLNSPSARAQWTSLDGNTVNPDNSLITSVSGPGQYELAIFDANGCAKRDTVFVPASENTPLAQAGEDREVGCSEMTTLNGNGSSPSVNGSFVYQWSVTEGTGSVLDGINTLTPSVQGPGVYQLVVTSTISSCSDTSTVNLELEALVQADIGADRTTCDDVFAITGNTPAGSTGRFESFDDDQALFTVDGSTVNVTEIGEGFNLVYILSAEGCGDYSFDTIRIDPEQAPMANDDVLEISQGSSTGSINVLDNDLRSGPVTVTLLSDPEFGEIVTNLNGTITFEAPVGTRAATSIRYQVCSNACPDLCSEATLRITIDDGRLPQTYNAITPNGDNLNDAFIFEILEINPDEFPDNELIIFNRWGDIIYEAAPYQNDWGGLSEDGSEVPEGTYYYILRLDIGEGDIIRGDVTVIR